MPGNEIRVFGATVRTGLSMVPHVGGALATAWSEWDSARRMDRVESTLREITDQLHDFKDILQRRDIGDAQMQFLEMVLRQAEVEHVEFKRRRFANLLVSYWISDEPALQGFDEASDFLRATAEFTEAHIAVLRLLYADGNERIVPYAEISDLVKATNVDGVGVMNDLCTRFGLVKRSWDLGQGEGNSKPLFSGHLSPEGIARKCFHGITHRGKCYLEFVLRGEKRSTVAEA